MGGMVVLGRLARGPGYRCLRTASQEQQGHTEDPETKPEEKADRESHTVLRMGPSRSRNEQESLGFSIIENRPAPQAIRDAGKL